MGLLRMAARTAVIAGTATAVAGGVRHHQQNKWAAQAEPAPAQYAAPVQYVVATPPPATGDMSEELTQLAALHQQGILTDEEFAAKKAQILGI